MRFGDVQAEKPLRRWARRPELEGCAVAECSKPAHDSGYCGAHARRWRLYGDPLIRVRSPLTKCGVEECTTTRSGGSEYCRNHRYRYERYGDPLAPVRRKLHPSHENHSCECTRCNRRLPLSDFPASKSSTRGHESVCRECSAAARRSDPDKAYEPSRRRRVRLRNGGEGDKGITRTALRARDGDLCFHCRVPMTFNPPRRGQYVPTYATFDHLLPISRGGLHTWDNVALACARCNLSRGSKLLSDWTGAPAA